MNNGFNRRLGLDISKSEMLSMRENKMNNKQIAERLGVSVTTVYRYIGKQPKGMPREYKCRPEPKPEVVKIIARPSLKLVSTVTLLKGDTSEYRIDSVKNIVEISGLLNGILDPATIDQTIRELTEVKNVFTTMKM
jgi:predicted DNA-binding transcriptional regulator AlpA